MQVFIILPFFLDGGVERWALNAREAMLDLGYGVEIFSVKANGKNCDRVDKGRISAHLNYGYISVLMLIFKNRGASDAVYITALTKLNLIFAFARVLGLINRHVPSVHLSLMKKESESKFKLRIRMLVHRLIMRWSDKVICVSQGIRRDLVSISPLYLSKLHVIYNPCFKLDEIVNQDNCVQFNGKEIEAVTLIGAGRLHEQKGFDLLLKAIYLIPEDLRNRINVAIFGDGPDRRALLALIQKLGLTNVELRGYSDSLFSELKNAQIFVLSSRYEGFGNVLAEALAAGCYCVSFDIDHGPSEILDGGRFGELIPANDTQALSCAIMRAASMSMMGAPRLVSFDRGKSRVSHVRRFTIESFSRAVNRLLCDLP
jgi:glycosyltransferase involved in cell wall biosynthesis